MNNGPKTMTKLIQQKYSMEATKPQEKKDWWI